MGHSETPSWAPGQPGAPSSTQPTLTPYGQMTAQQVNAQNRALQTQANQNRLGPSGVALQSTLLGNTQRKASGLLDPEIEQMLQQGIASSGVSRGMGVDSANLASAYRRALGLNINTIQEQALSDYSQLTADNPGAPVVGAQNFLTQPTTATASGGAALRGGSGGGGGGAAPTTPAVDPFGGYGGTAASALGGSFNPYTDVSGVYSPPADAASQNVNPFATNDYGIQNYWPAATAGGGNSYQDWADTFGYA